MAVCYFNQKYDKAYNCQYEVKKDGIEVWVDYDIANEIPEVNGMRTFGSNTEFDERDILIIDYKEKMNYLLKSAYYSGLSQVFGTPDGSCTTRFFSHFYFGDTSYEKMFQLPNDEKIKKIRVYSNAINELIGHPSIYEINSENEVIFKLKKDTVKYLAEIGNNNIIKLTVSDDWKTNQSYKTNEINIHFNGYIELELNEEINYEEVYGYIQELTMYFQLLRPNKFIINQILVEIKDVYYGLWIPIKEISYKNSYVKTSVDDKLVDYLSRCYNKLPYRNNRSEIRNIPYIILNTSRNLEDSFLILYRFIECYYKKQNIKDINKTFIKYGIENNYKDINKIENVENIVYEIISLRNHYVHNGYHISNQELYIAFPKINKKANPKNYRAHNVNFDWIYYRTKILYEIAIDIIFKDMLNYELYKFDMHF